MHFDAQTFRHLEIFSPLYAEDDGATLYSVFKKSCTAMGGRKIREFLARPLLNVKKINERLDIVEIFTKNYELAQNLTNYFNEIADIERILARIVANRANARDLLFLNKSLAVFPQIQELLKNTNHTILSKQASKFSEFSKLSNLLGSALLENPPIEIMSGGMFLSEYHEELAQLRQCANNSQKWLDDFLEKKKQESGIAKLRIKYSKTFGFCLEVSKGQVDKVPENWERRQTLVNAERYTLPELLTYQETVLSAEQKSFELEYLSLIHI